MLYADKRAATGSSPALQCRQPLPDVCNDGRGLYAPFPLQRNEERVRAVRFPGCIVSCGYTLIKVNCASFLYCLGTQLLTIILLIASIKENQPGRKVDVLC